MGNDSPVPVLSSSLFHQLLKVMDPIVLSNTSDRVSISPWLRLWEVYVPTSVENQTSKMRFESRFVPLQSLCLVGSELPPRRIQTQEHLVNLRDFFYGVVYLWGAPWIVTAHGHRSGCQRIPLSTGRSIRVLDPLGKHLEKPILLHRTRLMVFT